MITVLAPLLLAAASPDYAFAQLEDPAREAEAQALMDELRCLTCEGQSIAESNADMAADMRRLVRSRIAEGQRPEEVRGWLVDRYGGAVSYRPVGSDPVSWPLFAAPLLLLLLGFWMVRRRFKRGGDE
ncbi:cytochrome c-type biogenesis protein [Sphingomicrobium aestuariivivum]|uniref:cytochrome c-type biogenesis protein n=1 Tax=Sphingomicrobium aestuariivivum TaxID=1582356 RepID=UPI001FD676A5|nr:cytochrome c-type biogenesis protein [Sphingomicrobium aestuariivivum]MCJ8189770.1 cytochrome c-type biogenesis protein CcmH [Sphingomicrobium aestuariivivum]